jgi:hypothetical protein
VCAEASTVFRAIAADIVFNCCCTEIPSCNSSHHARTKVRKAFDLKCSRIFMLKWKPYLRVVFRRSILVWVLLFYTRSLLLVDSFDLHPSSQYTSVRVIPSGLLFSKMCLFQVSILSNCSPKCLTSSSWGSCTLFYGRRGTFLFMWWMRLGLIWIR